jgi:hypothetical protein
MGEIMSYILGIIVVLVVAYLLIVGEDKLNGR